MHNHSSVSVFNNDYSSASLSASKTIIRQKTSHHLKIDELDDNEQQYVTQRLVQVRDPTFFGFVSNNPVSATLILAIVCCYVVKLAFYIFNSFINPPLVYNNMLLFSGGSIDIGRLVQDITPYNVHFVLDKRNVDLYQCKNIQLENTSVVRNITYTISPNTNTVFQISVPPHSQADISGIQIFYDVDQGINILSILEIDNIARVPLTDLAAFNFSSLFTCKYDTPCVHNLVLSDNVIGEVKYEIQLHMKVESTEIDISQCKFVENDTCDFSLYRYLVFKSNYVNYTGQPPSLVIYENSKIFLIIGNIVCWFCGVLLFVVAVALVQARYLRWN